MSFRLKKLVEFPDQSIIHHITKNGHLYASRGRQVFFGRNGEWQDLVTFPFAWPRDLFGFYRWAARASRADKCNVYANRLGSILGIRNGSVYKITEDGHITLLFSIQGDCVLHGGICEDYEGHIYFGEYFTNPARLPVNVYRLEPDLSSWTVAYTFPEKTYRHVHGIYRDPFRPESFWITVGDYNNECYLLKTTDCFKTIETFGDGSQIWRAVRLFFTESHICWLTDSHLEQNYACRMDRSTGVVEIGQQISNSTWYGATTVEGLHVAFTTVEIGPGIKRRMSSVLVSEDAFRWLEVYRFETDILAPSLLFKFGVLMCPSGEMSTERFYLSGEGLRSIDGKSICVAFEKVNGIDEQSY